MLRKHRNALKIAIFALLLAVIGLAIWVFFNREPAGQPDYGSIYSPWSGRLSASA
jgi:hypothetical protein